MTENRDFRQTRISGPLMRRTIKRAPAGRSSDFRIKPPPHLPARKKAVVFAASVPGYSGATVTDFHRLPVLTVSALQRDTT